MTNASHDNALSSLDFHSLLPLITFYRFRGPSLVVLLGQTGMFGFDLRFALIPSKAVGIESYIFNFIILILLVTIYSLEQSLFNSVYSGTLDPYFHRAAISLLALDVEYFFLKPLFFIILFLLTIQIPIQPLNLAGMNRTERTFLQCLP